MHLGEIYAKTEAGVRELHERKFNLPIALRSLLIMIDGNRSVADVLESARALRVDAEAIAALERAGFIARKFGAPSTTKSATEPEQRSEDEVERFIAIQRKLSDALNAHLGFRGYLLGMRLQRAANLRDLHDFLPDFARALVKRMGIDAAAPIVAEFERLIVTRSG